VAVLMASAAALVISTATTTGLTQKECGVGPLPNHIHIARHHKGKAMVEEDLSEF
jgi:hypothetical protein